MDALSNAEIAVAMEYCKGLTDKEVADRLNKSIWTTKTQKRTIYRKLNISKDTELVLYMLCERLKKDFDLKEIRRHGLEVLFSVLFFIMQCSGVDYDARRVRSSRTNARTSGSATNKRNDNTYYL